MGDTLKKRIQQDHFESPVVEAMLNLIVAAGHVRERTQRICEQYGITDSQYNVLRILRGAQPHGRSRCEIAQRMLERAPDVTRLVDRLESAGLAERSRSSEDRRLSVTLITKKGLELLESMSADMRALEAYFAERVSRRDRRELSRICEGIYEEDPD